MKKILFFAATAFLFAACSSDEGNAPKVDEVAPQAVAFDIYAAGTTRAGQTGTMTTATLQKPKANGGGFGVFAYQTAETYPPTTSIAPNFMYNEPVTYASSVWGYETLKYWPNNTTADMHSNTGHASSTTNDYLSFFAYAPYVASASGSEGITGMSANSTTGDPTIDYTVTNDPTKSVDLLWGVTPSSWSYTDVANTTWNSTGAEDGLPLKNLLKPDVDTRIKFLFLHALARLGINVVAAVDQEAAGGVLDTKTKIFITSVTISDATSGGANLAPTGTLNLNNTTSEVAKWTQGTITSAFTSTLSGTAIENSLLYTSASDFTSKEGVLASKEKPVIANGQYYMLIPPAAATTLRVNVIYHVVTNDTQLNGNYSDVTNNITKDVNVTFQNGKAYTLKLVLGLTSVKLDAEVAPWGTAAATVVDLPQNYVNP